MRKETMPSIKKKPIGIIMILIASLSTALGQFFWKLAEGNLNTFLLTGFFLYFIGAGLMIISFQFGSLSVLHPLLSMGYVFAMIIGTIYLGETLSFFQIFGTILIMVGAVLIGGSNN